MNVTTPLIAACLVYGEGRGGGFCLLVYFGVCVCGGYWVAGRDPCHSGGVFARLDAWSFPHGS